MRFLSFTCSTLLLIATLLSTPVGGQPFVQQEWPVYRQQDLGLSYSVTGTTFKVWAPMAGAARLLLYKEPVGGEARVFDMQPGEQGTWQVSVAENCEGLFYTYQVYNRTKLGYTWSKEVSDPYAIATGVNGIRAAVVDLTKTDPPGWDRTRLPIGDSKAPVIIYEMHIRDVSMDVSSGIAQKGKYMGLTETGTTNKFGASTGLDHLASLGVTHVHVLPFFDFRSSDESSSFPPYNWGYDPLHYNTPEGTYASTVSDPAVRIRELKKMILAFHQRGLKVVMDVVYNHTGLTEDSHFEQLVPGYYFRRKADGTFSNASACGNETASEQPMFRKFMLESLLFWMNEYHIDGFRFDLMGIHDLTTMNEIARTLRSRRPDLLLYGEGWTAGSSPLPDSLRALKNQVSRLDQIAVFGDEFRDGIKGSVFDYHQPGFVSGAFGNLASVQFGIVGAVSHPQIDYTKVNYSKAAYATTPRQMIAYADCHDNHTLWDRLSLSAAAYSEAERKSMHRLALALVLTSQGIPFLQAGSEFLRSKKENENSYNAPDSINAIDWELKSIHQDNVRMVQALIDMRKQHPAFQLEDPAARLRFLDSLPVESIGFVIDTKGLGDSWKKVMVLLNASPERRTINLNSPLTKGAWSFFLRNSDPVDQVTQQQGDSITLGALSCTILYQ
jgi:pullulanase